MIEPVELTYKGNLIRFYNIERRKDLRFWEKIYYLGVPITVLEKDKPGNLTNFRQLLIDFNDTGLIYVNPYERMQELVSSRREKSPQQLVKGERCNIYEIGEEGKRLLELIAGGFEDNGNIIYKLDDVRRLFENKPETRTLNPYESSPFQAPPPSTSFIGQSTKRLYSPEEETEIDYSPIFESVEESLGIALSYINDMSLTFDRFGSNINRSEANIRNPIHGSGRRFKNIRDLVKDLEAYGIELSIDVFYLPPEKFKVRTSTGEPLEEEFKKLLKVRQRYEAARGFIEEQSDRDILPDFVDSVIGGECQQILYGADSCITVPDGLEFERYIGDDKRLDPELRLPLSRFIEETKKRVSHEERENLEKILYAVNNDHKFWVGYPYLLITE